MSAFIVSDKHIDTILTFSEGLHVWHEEHGIVLQGTELNLAGQVLIDQNYASYNYRYDESHQTPSYTFKRQPMPSAVQVIKACDSLEYQSSETEDYRETWAYKLTESIRENAIGKLPGYNEAEWSID